MKKYILLISSLFIWTNYSQAQDDTKSATNSIAIGGITGVVAGAPTAAIIGGYADELVFKTNHAFSQYDGNVTKKILKDYRLPSSGVVTIEATTRSRATKKTTLKYKSKADLQRILNDLQASKPSNGTIVTNPKGHQPYRAQRTKMRLAQGAKAGGLAGSIGAIVAIYINGSDSAQAGFLSQRANNNIPLFTDPDEITTTMLAPVDH